MGYRVEKLISSSCFTLSAAMAGVAGALYVPQVGIINPSEFQPSNSIEAVIWVAVGGRGTLAGAALGAIIVNVPQTWFTSVFPEYWLFALGALFVLVTMFLPKGVLGLIQRTDWSPSNPTPKRRAARSCPSLLRRAQMSGLHATEPQHLTSSLLYLDGVAVTFDGFKALRGLSLAIAPGEMRAIIGPNGAGKTTMMDVITGKTRPNEGTVYVRRYDRLDRTRRSRNCRTRHRPQISKAHRLRIPHRGNNLRLAIKAPRQALRTLFWRSGSQRKTNRRRTPRNHQA